MDYAAPQVDASTGTLESRAIFDNKERRLLPGLFARVRTPVGKLSRHELRSSRQSALTKKIA